MLPTEPVTAKGIIESYGIHLFNDYGIKYKSASESVIFKTSQMVKETRYRFSTYRRRETVSRWSNDGARGRQAELAVGELVLCRNITLLLKKGKKFRQVGGEYERLEFTTCTQHKSLTNQLAVRNKFSQ